VIVAKIRALWARPWTRRVLLVLFLSLVAFLLARQARTIEWNKVATAARAYDVSTLATALALSAFSYLIYSCFDLLGRRYIRIKSSKLSIPAAMRTAFVSFAFNQSIGSMIGAVAFRFRLYAKLGLSAVHISKILALSVVTNWLGYSALAGLIFVTGTVTMPTGWDIGTDVMRIIGGILLIAAAAYMLLCAAGKQRTITVRTQNLHIPSLPLACGQLSLSIVHWPATAAIIYLLLDGRIEFPVVLGALLLSSIATVITHIPAGLGVLEAIFVGLFRHRIPIPELLAALLIFRAVYHIAPLMVATTVYLITEARGKNVANTKQAVKSKRTRSARQSRNLHSSSEQRS
jgi:uncharacterized membrane protein YbhN (UPF0104 family)